MLRLSGPITVITYVMADESNALRKEDALFEGEGKILSSANLELAAKISDKSLEGVGLAEDIVDDNTGSC